MAEQFRLYLLGGFRLERDEQESTLPRAKVKTLLAYLALHPQEHPREKLAALHWGDVTDEQARASLRVALNALRKEIHPDLLLTDRETVQLNPAFPLWIDAKEIFDFRMTNFDLDPQVIENLKSKFENYKGELLAGFYDEWIEAEREKYRTLHLELLLRVVEQHRGASDYANAILSARKMLEIDRAHETAHQHLIFLYAAQGDRTGALKQFDECVAALNEELGVEPSPETIALAKQINQKPQTKSDAAAQTNLPKPLTSFVGRETEIAEIKRLLGGARREERGARVSPPSSLLTLTGPGGSGKTRLAIQVGRALLDEYADGVWWVELAPLADAALVPQQIARALGVQEEPNTPLLESLTNFLRGRALLLILDNCEHLIEECAQITNHLLIQSPNVSILATSREVLNIAGEQLYPVAPLDVPRAAIASFAAQGMEFSAVRLFVERARLADPRFELNESNVLPIVQICTRLDGIPLAIELAAARVKQMSVSDIAARLDSRFELLVGTRTASPRQQTLRALIDWSYNLLSEDERAFFNRLGAFAGSWSAEAAAHVAGEHLARATSDVLLAALVDKSLVVAETHAVETRYHLLETVREYAREKLDVMKSQHDAARSHLAYFVALAEDAAQRLWGREAVATLNRLEHENDNLRAALAFALHSGDIARAMQLAGALDFFWNLRNYFDEAERWYAQVLEHDSAEIVPRLRARVFSGAGTIAWNKIDLTRAEALHRRALELFELAQDAHGIALSLNNLGVVLSQMGNLEPAWQCIAQALAVARTQGDALVTVYALNSLATALNPDENADEIEEYLKEAWHIARREGDANSLAALGSNLAEFMRNRGEYASAYELLEQAMDPAREIGNFHLIHVLVRERGSVLALLGRFEEAKTSLRDAFALAQERRDPWLMGASFSRWAWLESLMGNFARAARLLGYAAACLERFSNVVLPHATSNAQNQALVQLRAKLGDVQFELEWVCGRKMTEVEALQYIQAAEI